MKIKLIRDLLEPKGTCIELRPVASADEHTALLIAKLHEEIGEVMAGYCRDATEYADVLQALMDLAQLNGVAWKKIERECAHKHGVRGGFAGGKVMISRGNGEIRY